MIIKQGRNIIANNITVADNFILKFMGLMGKKSINQNEGLILKNTGRIHTSFMKFPIKVLYVSNTYEILHIEILYPWKIGKSVKRTKHVIELCSDNPSNIKIGEKIIITQEE